MCTDKSNIEYDFLKLLRQIGKAVMLKYDNYFLDDTKWNNLAEYHSIIEAQNQIPFESRVRIDLSKGSAKWVKNFANVLTNLIPATPNHKKWFEECYSYASRPNNNIYNNYCCDQYGNTRNDINNCDKCLDSEFGDILTVNYSPHCLDKLIDLFWSCSNELVRNKLPESRDVRFILSGFAGEGKSAWLNNFLSIKQDQMWEKKLFNVKIAVTDAALKEKFYTAYQKRGARLPLFFRQVVGTKIVRLYQEHYRHGTSIIVYKDYSSACNNNNLISCLPPNHSNHNKESIFEDTNEKDLLAENKSINMAYGSYILSYKLLGTMSQEEKKKILDLKIGDNEWENDIERLYRKTQKSLTNEQIKAINTEIKNLYDDNIISKEEYEYTWCKDLTRSHRDECPEEISDKLTEMLINYGYRFFIVFDGVDGHHNMEMSEYVNELFLDELLSSIFTPQSNPWMASLLIVIRDETINKKIAKLVFQGTTWGSIRRLRLAPTDLKDILQRRMNFIAKVKNYGIFYEHLNTAIPNIISELVSNYVECESLCLDEETFNYDKSYQIILCLLRYNRRKALGFIELFVRSILWKLERIGELNNVSEISSSGSAISRIESCKNNLIGKHYLFWDALIYRTKAYYHEPYEYKFNGKFLDKKLKDDSFDSKIIYGSIPNVFNFINPEIATNDFVFKYQDKNKLTIRIRILLALERNPQRIKTIYKNIKTLYNLQTDHEVKWEIHELFSVGLIKIKHGKASVSDNIKMNNLESNPLVEVTPFWKILKRYIYSKYVLRGLVPDLYIPQSIKYENFMTFQAIPSGITFGEDKKIRENKFIDAISSEIAVITLVLSYLSSHEKRLYHNYQKFKNEYSDGFFSNKDFVFIRDMYNSLIKNLCSSKGFLNNKKEVIKKVYEELERVRASI